MWVRKQIDLSGRDLMRAFRMSVVAGPVANGIEAQIDQDSLLCLSVRSGFDLLLSCVDWPPGSEVLMSAMTIGDMARIVEHHGYVPVPVDLDPRTLSPSIEDLQRAITPRTQAFLLAQLMGGSVSLDRIKTFCDDHQLMFIDDRAQAFTGTADLPRSSADVTLYSFGSLKTCTALGGAVLIIRDPKIREMMAEVHRQYPVDSSWNYQKKIGRYAMIRCLSRPRIANVVVNTIRFWGYDHDAFAAKLAHGFAGDGFFDRIRKQPSKGLRAFLAYRLRHDETAKLQQRKHGGEVLEQELAGRVEILGSKMNHRTHWLFAILVADPAGLVPRLWAAGFDATTRSSLRCVAPTQNVERQDCTVQSILNRMVILPLDINMPTDEIKRMARVIREAHPDGVIRCKDSSGYGRSEPVERQKDPAASPSENIDPPLR